MLPEIKRELKRMAIALGICCLVMYGVCACLGYWQWQTALGCFLGYAVAMGNYWWLSRALEKAVDMETPEQARMYQVSNYYIRTFVLIAVAAAALYLPFINGWPVVIALIMPRFIIYALQFIDSRRESSRSDVQSHAGAEDAEVRVTDED